MIAQQFMKDDRGTQKQVNKFSIARLRDQIWQQTAKTGRMFYNKSKLSSILITVFYESKAVCCGYAGAATQRLTLACMKWPGCGPQSFYGLIWAKLFTQAFDTLQLGLVISTVFP